MKEVLISKIKQKEEMIAIYSDRDEIRTEQLKSELHEMNMELLEVMTNEAM